MRATIVLAVALLAGCGSKPVYSVGGHRLVLTDEGYYYTDGTDYCGAGGLGQMMLRFVDYNYICAPGIGATPDPKVSPHAELDIILTTGLQADGYPNHPNMNLPYDATGTVNCMTGPSDLIVARFSYFGNGTDHPASFVAYDNQAHLQFTQFDKAKKKPNKGNFDLHFGADEVKDSFSIDTCN